MKSVAGALVLSAAMASLASGAPVAVAFSDLGPGDTYSTSNGSLIGSSALVACPFVSQVTGTVASYDVPARILSGSSVTLRLLQDAGGVPSSTLLESVPLSLTSTLSLVNRASVSHPQLVAGQTYWLELLPDASTQVGWANNTTGLTGFGFNNGSGWIQLAYTAPAFRVDAVVPEPAAMGLLVIPAFLALRRRREQV